jgi:hypothetical protein
MQMKTVEHLSYSPLKSVAFGHAPSKRDIRVAWDTTQRFLARHTQGVMRNEIFVEAVGPAGYGGEKMTFPTQQHALDTFGAPEDSKDHWCRWRVGIDAIPKAFDLISRAYPVHRNQAFSFGFNIAQDFRWRGIADTTLAGSSLGILFSDFNGMFFQPDYVFPFAFDAQEHRQWLRALMADSPFRLSELYFRRAIPTKAGSSYRLLKLEKNWLTSDP